MADGENIQILPHQDGVFQICLRALHIFKGGASGGLGGGNRPQRKFYLRPEVGGFFK